MRGAKISKLAVKISWRRNGAPIKAVSGAFPGRDCGRIGPATQLHGNLEFAFKVPLSKIANTLTNNKFVVVGINLLGRNRAQLGG